MGHVGVVDGEGAAELKLMQQNTANIKGSNIIVTTTFIL